MMCQAPEGDRLADEILQYILEDFHGRGGLQLTQQWLTALAITHCKPVGNQQQQGGAVDDGILQAHDHAENVIWSFAACHRRIQTAHAVRSAIRSCSRQFVKKRRQFCGCSHFVTVPPKHTEDLQLMDQQDCLPGFKSFDSQASLAGQMECLDGCALCSLWK